MVDYAARIRDLGCTIQGFVCPRGQDEDGPDFDGNRWPRDADCRVIDDLSTHDVFDRMVRGLDNLEEQGLKFDTLYYDGFSAYYPLVEDFSETHRVTRRETFEAQNACCADASQHQVLITQSHEKVTPCHTSHETTSGKVAQPMAGVITSCF